MATMATINSNTLDKHHHHRALQTTQRRRILILSIISITLLVSYSVYKSGSTPRPTTTNNNNKKKSVSELRSQSLRTSNAAMAQEELMILDQDGTTTPLVTHDIETSSVPVQERTNDDSSTTKPYDLAFHHCGPKYTSSLLEQNQHWDLSGRELLLLHGAKFTKENWKDSGILQKLCAWQKENDHVDDEPLPLSVTALDLSVKSDAMQLASAFDGLTAAGVISGRPLVIVSPSASGKGVVDLAEVAAGAKTVAGGEYSCTTTNNNTSKKANCGNASFHGSLQEILSAWIPVASPSVLKSTFEAVKVFAKQNIPVLAVNGKEDTMGASVSSRLEKYAAATKVVLGRNHWCYLDEPDLFVSTVGAFLSQVREKKL